MNRTSLIEISNLDFNMFKLITYTFTLMHLLFSRCLIIELPVSRTLFLHMR